MQRLFSFVLFVIVLAFIVHYGLDRDDTTPRGDIAPAGEPAELVGATLLPGLDGYPFPVTHSNPETQRWVNQAMALTYGFNHGAAQRSFLKAAALEPECAMCWWGAALVLGPHINAPMDPANAGKAWAWLQRAQSAPRASAREKAYIAALSARYAKPAPEDRTALDQAYADAMASLSRQFPDDLDAATLYAEALMNLQPWDFYHHDQQPKGRTPEIVALLEEVIARNPEHPGALHLYVHAVEPSATPERGAEAADRLRDLVPGAGHLVHMPAHIYTRVGRYHDAALANLNAIAADDAFLAACQPAPGVYLLGYVPHNHHYLWWSSSMSGQSAQALAAAEETARRASDGDLMTSPGLEFLQDFWVTPLKARVQFGRWDEIAATPRPAAELPYAVAVWDFAQGMAAVRQGRHEAAREHLKALGEAAANPAIDAIYVGPQHSLGRTLAVAERVLAGELALATEDMAGAIAALEQAVAEEDANNYFEPPLWHQPARQFLGNALLAAGHAAHAEQVFRDDLLRNRGNGWSLFGLVESLKAQGKHSAEEERAFAEAWKHADMKLSAAIL